MHSNRWYIVANGNSNRLLQLRQNGTDRSWFANDGQLYHGSGGTGDKYWRQGNDGSGSGLDADTVDGIHGGSFIRSDTDDGIDYQHQIRFYSNSSIHSTSAYEASLEVYQGSAQADAFMAFHVAGDYAGYFGLDGSINDFACGGWSFGNNRYRFWHEGNDGSGSGLDADTLDGINSGSFLRSDANDDLGGILSYTSNTARLQFTNSSYGQQLHIGG